MFDLLTIVIIYIFICFVWGAIAVEINHKLYPFAKDTKHFVCFIFNFSLMPYCIYLVVRRKFWKK